MSHDTWEHASSAELANALATSLLMDCAPVGVRVLHSAAEVESCAWPQPASALSYCAAVRNAGQGAALLLTRPDINCSTSPRTLGLEPGFRDPEFVTSYVSGGLYRDHEVARRVLEAVPALDNVKGLAVAPLSCFGAGAPVDVVILALSPYGAMRVSQAAAFHGTRVKTEAIGMHGVCVESTVAPIVSGEVTLSLLCSGTRHVAGWDDRTLSVGVPANALVQLVDGLVRTAQRFETDERKNRIVRSCRVGSQSRHVLGQLDALQEGAAYFCDFEPKRHSAS